MIGCQRCGLVLDVVQPVASQTRTCHRCAATMRPMREQDVTAMRLLAGTRTLNAARRQQPRPHA